VSALDFASLYPSIIRAHCMCPSTIVRDPQYAALEGIEYYAVDTGMGAVTFAQGTSNVVPALLEDLARFRKDAKKKMAAAKDAGDSFMTGVYNGQQLAYKVSMNSVYGFFGATRGILPLVEMAAAVTATGRAMIEHSKAMAEALVPGTRVIYGDECRVGDRG
jgi:DNA polymerase delta subunit 1